MDLLFIFGKDKELSLIEFESYCNANKIEYTIKEQEQEIILVKISKSFNYNKYIKKSGGTIKIAKITNIKDIDLETNKYVISAYNTKNYEKFKQELKEHFKKNKTKAIIKKPKRGNYMMPSEYHKRKLTEFIAWKEYFAQTIAVSDVLQNEQLEKQRPKNDFIRMMSIRMAKILINLSQAKKEILDPFCGYGVLLEQAALNNLNALGMDKNPRAVESTKTNLKHIIKSKNLKTKYKIYPGDARKANDYFKKVECVVTEPYLGPYIKRKNIPVSEAKTLIKSLTLLYSRTLITLSKIVQKRIIFITPSFQTKEGEIEIDINQILKQAKLKPIKSIDYPARFIKRKIWILEKA